MLVITEKRYLAFYLGLALLNILSMAVCYLVNFSLALASFILYLFQF